MNEAIVRAIRTIPDFPKPGILFRDVTTLMGDAQAFSLATAELSGAWRNERVAKVAGLEARGFVFGAALAVALGAGFVPVRKKGKLPGEAHREEYALEYGTDVLELHVDAVKPGERVLLVDDLIATGGTAGAGLSLLRRVGAEVVGAAFVVDLPDLGGAAKLRASGLRVTSLVAFSGH